MAVRERHVANNTVYRQPNDTGTGGVRTDRGSEVRGANNVEENPEVRRETRDNSAFVGTTADNAARPIAGGGASMPLHGSMFQVDGLKATIDKVFKLWRAGGPMEKDLVNKHTFTTDNKIDLLVDGDKAFPEIFKAIDSAQESINISYYIFKDDEMGKKFVDKLLAKVKEGVEVNMMIDGIGSTQMMFSPSRGIINRLENGGVNVIRNHMFNPLGKRQIINHPDHRKLVIVDGQTAFTGGMNVANHYLDEYHDIMIKVQGSAAQQMQAEWLTSWLYLGGELDQVKKDPAEIRDQFFPEAEQPAGAMKARVLQCIPGENPEIFKSYIDLIEKAESSIKIENPYCTNPEIQDALIDAAKRGVDVTVILPGESDHGFSHLAAKAKYPTMIEAGCKIYEYPGFNHGKIMVVDGRKTTVGSSNLDDVALRHIYELNVMIDDEGFSKQAESEIFDVDVAKSKLMQADHISTMDRVSGAFFNLFHDII